MDVPRGAGSLAGLLGALLLTACAPAAGPAAGPQEAAGTSAVGASPEAGGPAAALTSPDPAAPTGLPTEPPAAPGTEAPAAPVEPAAAPVVQGPALVQAAGGGDGDSWKDTSGREYRLGMVNAPEVDECFGSEATAERKALIADGFRADAYTVDTYGRSVSVVTTAGGLNLNVHLARNGFADDRYLAQFRTENLALAAELDRAFAAAKTERAGLWGRCAAPSRSPSRSTEPAQVQPVVPAQRAGCHTAYVTCIPVKGNGSGSGEANDLDCGDIGKKVELREVGVDPYRLDANSDGYGCESYG